MVWSKHRLITDCLIAQQFLGLKVYSVALWVKDGNL